MPAWGIAPGLPTNQYPRAESPVQRILIPNIRLVVFHPVFFEEHPEFVLKRPGPMMLLLAVNVSIQRFHIGRSDGKTGVTALSCKISQCRRLRFQPFGRSGFQLLHQIGNGDGARQSDGQMHVVRHPARAITFAIGIADDGGQIAVDLWPHIADEQRPPVFGAENEVKDDEAQGLWHGDGAGFQP